MNKMFQASTLNALMLGNYDSTISVSKMLEKGDTGIGTYEGLDGEAIFFNGKAYKGTALGNVVEMKKEDNVAFGNVTKFDETVKTNIIVNINSLADFKNALYPYIKHNLNQFYVIKSEGVFKNMHVRACFKQETKPYKTLAEVASCQREFKYQNVSGYVIAIYCPNYVEGINLPGWHFHFLSKDYSKGGHILDLSSDEIFFKWNEQNNYEIVLPTNEEFTKLNLCEDLKAKTEAVEGASQKK